jgi:hypothetical protein
MFFIAATVGAEEFRIASRVFLGEKPEPISTTITLFDGETVYDFVSHSPRIAVFRKPAGAAEGRFILIDPSRELRTELGTERIRQFATGLKVWCASQDDPLLRFYGSPRFTEQWDPREGLLTLDGARMRYRLQTEPMPSRPVSLQYREFCDWYARLNAMLHPGSLPPFARLELNAALSKYQVMPREVRLTIPADKSHHKEDLLLRSEHTVTWRLSKEDRDRIDRAGKYLVQFKEVDLATYRAEEKQTAAK